MSSLVPTDHYNMAIQGLRQLLQPEDKTDTCREPASSETVLRLTDQSLDSAILILPLVNDYLGHYMEMLEITLDSSTSSLSTTSASSSSESYDVSSESPTGSVGLLLKTVAGFANDLENTCIAALHTLHLLTVCEGIRDVLLHMEQRQTTETYMEVEVNYLKYTTLTVIVLKFFSTEKAPEWFPGLE